MRCPFFWAVPALEWLSGSGGTLRPSEAKVPFCPIGIGTIVTRNLRADGDAICAGVALSALSLLQTAAGREEPIAQLNRPCRTCWPASLVV